MNIYAHNYKDRTGQRYGTLIAVKRIGRSSANMAIWLCKCDCGGTRKIQSGDLALAKTCGHRCPLNMSAPLRTKHGGSSTRLYKIWSDMLARCRNPRNKAWDNYGGRGIKVCKKWLSFENFRKDMGKGYIPREVTIDRRNNNKGYYPSNCRWVTRKVQSRNTRRNHFVDTPYGRVCLTDAARMAGIGVAAVMYRFHKGYTGEKLLSKRRVNAP